MANITLQLVVDWGRFEQRGNAPGGNNFYGRFFSAQWLLPDGTTKETILAADLNPGDTISFQVTQQSYTNSLYTIYLKQLVVIITQQPGTGGQASSPFEWVDPQQSGALAQPVGLVVITPANSDSRGKGVALFTGTDPTLTAQAWNSGPTDTLYPAGVSFTVSANISEDCAFEATVAAEIWDSNPVSYRAFYTLDPDMDVSTTN
jgi:hypothetical protein